MEVLSDDRKNILITQMVPLMKSTRITGSTFWQQLVDKGITSQDDIEKNVNNASATDDGKASWLYTLLLTKKNSDYEVVCDLLNKEGMIRAERILIGVTEDSRRVTTGPVREEKGQYMLPSIQSSGQAYGRKALRKLQTIIARAVITFHSTVNSSIDLNVPVGDMFVEPVCITRMHTPAGQVDETLHHYTDILLQPSGLNNPLYVYLQGSAGVGKTTLLIKILNDWASLILSDWYRKRFNTSTNVRRVLSRFEFVLPIVLREVRKRHHIHDAICHQLHLDGEQAKTLLHLLNKNANDVLFLIDGYDEYDTSFSPAIEKLSIKELFADSSIIITSRHCAGFHFKPTLPAMTHIILKGFDKGRIEYFISKTLKGHKDIAVFSSKITRDEILLDLSKTPAYLNVLCTSWKENKDEFDSSINMLELIIKEMLCTYRGKKQETTLTPKEKVFSKHEKDMIMLGLLAFTSISSDTDKIEASLASNETPVLPLMDYGFYELLQKNNRFYAKFAHGVFLDFFRAYCMVMCDSDTRQNICEHILNSTEGKTRITRCLRFMKKNDNCFLVHIIKKLLLNRISDRHMLHTDLVLNNILGQSDKTLKLPKKIKLDISEYINIETLHNFFKQDGEEVISMEIWACSVKYLYPALGINSRCLETIHIQSREVGYYLDTPIYNISARCLGLRRIRIEGFRSLDTADCAIFVSFFQKHTWLKITENSYFVQILVESSNVTTPLPELNSVHFAHCCFPLESVLLTMKKKSHMTVTKWVQAECPLHSRSKLSDECEPRTGDSLFPCTVENLAKCFEHTSSVKHIEISGTDTNASFFSIFVQHVSSYQGLTTLTLRHLGDPNALFGIAKALPYELEELNLADIFADDTILKELSNLLPKLASLKKIYFPQTFSVSKQANIEASFHNLHNLEILDMSMHTTDAHGYRTLSQGITKMNGLIDLRLGKCKELNAIREIILSSENLYKLRVLDLTQNIVDKQVLDIIAKTVRNMKNLEEFRVCRCEDINSMNTLIECCPPRLRILDLSGNIKQPNIGEVYDTLGEETGNKVDRIAHAALGSAMSRLNLLQELRLCECNHPDALEPFIEAIKVLKDLKVLILSGNMADSNVCKMLGERLKDLTQLRVLRLFKSAEFNAISPVIDGLESKPELLVLDISGVKEKTTKRLPNSISTCSSNVVAAGVFSKLGHCISQMVKLTELRLCTCKETDAIMPLVHALSRVPSLEVLDISGNVIEQKCSQELAMKLPLLPGLTEFRLCLCKNNNGFLSIIDNIFCLRNLKSLDIIGVYVEQNNANLVVSEKIRDTLNYLKKLEELRLCSCFSTNIAGGNIMVERLQQCKNLKILDIGKRALDERGLKVLGDNLPKLTQLRQIHLDESVLDMEKASNIFKPDTRYDQHLPEMSWVNFIIKLSFIPLIKVIELSNNKIGHDGLLQLANNLRYHKHLDCLLLAGCKLSNIEDLLELVESIPGCPSLRILSVRNNQFGDKMELILSKTKELSSLQLLMLRNNNLSQGVWTKIENSLRKNMPRIHLN